jgi:polyisoprenoid-binding protein YceI
MRFIPELTAFLAVPLLVLAVSAAAPSPAAAPEAGGKYEIDPKQSSLIFRCKHLDTAWIFGRFNEFSGSITIDVEKPESSSVEVTVKAESIDTGVSGRDNHLRSPDFFDVKQFPTATFKSKSVAKKGAHAYSVTGDLSIHGVTRSVTIEMEHTGSSSDAKKGKLVGFLGTLTIQRKDFGIAFMPDGLSNDVHMTISFEAAAK